MKIFVLTAGFLTFLSVIGLKLFFMFSPAPPISLEEPISDIIPKEIDGWSYADYDLANSELANSSESGDRIASTLDLDDFVLREYTNGNVRVLVYVAYWTPGKVPYRSAGAHTPDTCWIKNGFTCLERKHSIPFQVKEIQFKNAEFGIYEKDMSIENVYFWHLVGGEPFGYEQKGTPNIFGALIDLQKYGLDLRQEQFFIRLSSNEDLDSLKQIDGFNEIIKGLSQLPLSANEIAL